MKLQVICDSHGFQLLDSIHKNNVWLSCGCIIKEKCGEFEHCVFPLACPEKKLRKKK